MSLQCKSSSQMHANAYITPKVVGLVEFTLEKCIH